MVFSQLLEFLCSLPPEFLLLLNFFNIPRMHKMTFVERPSMCWLGGFHFLKVKTFPSYFRDKISFSGGPIREVNNFR
jgi:hypothetical protein